MCDAVKLNLNETTSLIAFFENCEPRRRETNMRKSKKIWKTTEILDQKKFRPKLSNVYLSLAS